MKRILLLLTSLIVLNHCNKVTEPEVYDVVISGGMVIDGSGAKARSADVAIRGERIVKIGSLDNYQASTVIDASGKVVTPGFINMLSWATTSLITDGRGLSDVVQGVTLEVFGEGWSMGPLSEANKKITQQQINSSPEPFNIKWTSLGEYLDYLAGKGISPNVASFVGATTVRINALGFADRAPNAVELTAMQDEVRVAMQEGALGVGSSLIYAPAFYAKTDELIALSKVAGEYGGMYISHMRSEGNRFLESIDELVTIAKQAHVDAEIYHLKASGNDNWPKMKLAIEKVAKVRSEGLNISADMYTYPAGATGLDAAMPPWVQEGGHEAWVKRLQDPMIRAKVIVEMKTPTDEWENLLLAAGAEGVLLPYFKNPQLKKYTGQTLAAVAKDLGLSAEETAIDLVIKDDTRVEAIYFLMSEDNIRLKIKQPWVSFGSDAEAVDPEIARKYGSTHPRTYGNVARVFAKYVRDEKILSLEDTVRKLTSLPASHLKIRDRGLLKAGYFADVVIFDANKVQDHATFENPHQLSTGIDDVFINGVQVLKDGKHTGATPGQVVRGPGWLGWKEK